MPPGEPDRPAWPSPRGRIAVALVVAVAVVVLDQVTKSLAVVQALLGTRPPHRPVLARLSYNTGVAFSIGTGLTLPIVVIVVVVVALVAWFGRAVPNTAAAVGVGMILGGAVGNLADRLFRGHHGAVVDFIYSGFWPTFNVADSSIVCGCIVLGVALWRSGATRHRPENEAGASSERRQVSEPGRRVRSWRSPVRSPVSGSTGSSHCCRAGHGHRWRGSSRPAGCASRASPSRPGAAGSKPARSSRPTSSCSRRSRAHVAQPAGTGEVPFRVVYEDEDVIVVDKPPGLVVHPDAAHESGTLVAGLLASYPELAGCPSSGAARRTGRGSCTGSTRTPPACSSWPAAPTPTGRSPPSWRHARCGARTWRSPAAHSEPRPESSTRPSAARCVIRRGWRSPSADGRRRTHYRVLGPLRRSRSRRPSSSCGSRPAAPTRSAST